MHWSAEFAHGRTSTKARRGALTERIVLAMQARLLIEGSPAAVADAFCASRLGSDGWGRTFGTLPADIDPAPLLARALPS